MPVIQDIIRVCINSRLAGEVTSKRPIVDGGRAMLVLQAMESRSKEHGDE